METGDSYLRASTSDSFNSVSLSTFSLTRKKVVEHALSLCMMASAQDIRPRKDSFATQPQYFSTSPTVPFHSPSSHGSALQRTISLANAKHLKPFATEDIKVLLLENVNQTGRDILSGQGYQVEFLKSSLPEDQLIEKIR